MAMAWDDICVRIFCIDGEETVILSPFYLDLVCQFSGERERNCPSLKIPFCFHKLAKTKDYYSHSQ